MSGLLSRYEGHLRNFVKAWHCKRDASRCEAGDRVSLSSCHSDIGIPINFHQESGIVTFEALNSLCLSRCQSDVRLPLQRRRRLRTFSRVYTRASDFPSSCEMKEEPAFNPLQGNPAFLQVRATRCPFHLRHQIQGTSQLPIAEGSLLLRCLWKGGITLRSNRGNQLSSRDDLLCTELSLSYCTVVGVPLDLRLLSQGISVLPK